MTGTDRIFFALLKDSGLPQPEPEFAFHPERKWRADYAWPEQRLILEVEGGVFSGGRHTRGAGFLGDIEKYNLAACLGYRLIRVVPKELLTQQTVDLIARALAVDDRTMVAG